jgi:GGDEF domain-containing protein
VFVRVELDELDALNTAFGRSIGAQLIGEFRSVVRRYSSPGSDIGAVAPGALVAVAPYAKLEIATSDAEAVQAALRENRIDAAQGLRLSASVGIAGTDQFGYEFETLMIAAATAATSARTSGGDAIVTA